MGPRDRDAGGGDVSQPIRTRPSKARIVEAQRDLIAQLHPETREAPLERCWACCLACDVERAHIVARRNGGSEEPLNFLLLCHLCHVEQPDTADLDVQIAWVMARESATKNASGTGT